MAILRCTNLVGETATILLLLQQAPENNTKHNMRAHRKTHAITAEEQQFPQLDFNT
jgi:hypothetical protein